MNTFALIVSAYHSVIHNGPAVYCGVTTLEGSLGLEAKHEAVLAVLKEPSIVYYKTPSGREKSIPVKNGLLSFRKNVCTITISTA